ncbi:RICIN domain-containing protein [Streptomyces antarcticus]|uniref:RICIN domain-containing protein n=1 Tax=Streptomyces antarcticus TaxID=2996458 RepID=UPI00226F7B5D|nr:MULTISPECIES: RICIN domain-containing protein [unclassified Streptomyces]MCY0943826.1 ricin-type beta-trefoil lectin domain protein [Streptomyces sp. H34-AA3]MCZ4085716.1 ricin-type beta-trefoil lectin domain protein [Streptomyces sp. H34-S5]
MLAKSLVALGGAAVLALGVLSTPANAVVVHSRFQNQVGNLCLDYRADWGPYVTGCNDGPYQKWWYNRDAGPNTALAQDATSKCLGVTNGRTTMSKCRGTAQQWTLRYTSGSGIPMIVNVATRQCLAQGGNKAVVVAPCTGGNSQRWEVL